MLELFDLFPIPVMRSQGQLGNPLVAQLIEHFSGLASRDNNSSSRLSHTEMLRPDDSPLLLEATRLITPQLIEFGAQLFGERLEWVIKELWVNFLETGGHQAMHNHANSFTSGIIYLTPSHASSRTVFMKSPGGTEFLFRNDHRDVAPTPYGADKWVSPEPQAGDLLLFPSYLMHAVPPNRGALRITLSFNAIPARLDSWGYGIRFGA
jgi:uncharacterized protein (TIGR02466 family)